MGLSLVAAAAFLLVFGAFEAADVSGLSVRRRLAADADGALRQRDRSGPLSRLGRLLGRGAVDDADEALVGAVAVAFPVVALSLGAAVAVLCLPVLLTTVGLRRRARRRRRTMSIERQLPEVIDLLGLLVSAGRPTSAALSEISSRVGEPFRSELAAVSRRTSAGEPFVDSVRRLRVSLGPSVTSVVHAVTAAETDGAPLLPALQRASDEAQRRRRVCAEEAARRVPVLMLFPLVFCVLPAFCLLTVVPLLMGTLSDLRLVS